MQDWDLTVTDIDYVIDRPPNPSWRIADFANSRSHILAYAISGRAHYRIAGIPYPIRTGALIFMPRGTDHTAASDGADPWHFISVAFDLAGPVEAIEALGQLPAVTYEVPLDLSAIFHEMYATWTARLPGFSINIRGQTSTILHRIIHEHSLPELRRPHTRRISAITELLRENFAVTYSVAALAARSGLSPSHFRLMFKEVTGMTATAYQQHIKITKAIEFLTSGEYNVTETARLAGFRDVYYFSRLFKKVTGAPPSSLTRR